MRYFENLVPGQVEESGTRSVSREEMLSFARQYDPHCFHADREAAKQWHFGDLIASGIHTMAIWRQLDHQIAMFRPGQSRNTLRSPPTPRAS